MTTDTQERVRRHPIGPDGLLIVRLHDGSVRIRGTSGDTATVRSTDGTLVEGLDIETGNGSLSIRARRGPDFLGRVRRSPRTTELEVDVPAGATVVIEAASADIGALGLHGDQRYRTASGDLDLRDVSGSVAADTVSGDLEIVATGAATLSVRTVSGDLRVRAGVLGELRAATTSGDLFIAGLFEGPGPYAIETVSGDLVLAPANDVRIELATITGNLRTDVDGRRDDDGTRRAFVMGHGGPTIGFRSTSGDLRVARSATFPAGAAAPTNDPTDQGAPTPPTPPAPSTPPIPPSVPSPSLARPSTAGDTMDDARLAVLRDLERGKIDVAEAGRRLEGIDHA